MADRSANLPGPEAEDPLDHTSAHDPSDRLDSWKEIAAYLRRGLRTVQRWEKEEGLPVRRVQHDERANVFAYKSEVDVWLRSGRPGLTAEDEEDGKQAPETVFAAPEHGNGRSHVGSRQSESQPEPHFSRRRWHLWLSGTAVAFVVLVAVAIYFLKSRPASVLHFHPRDMVLIASFQNRTGDPLFDGTMEAALGRELANSQFVNVAPRVRINDTLALMRRPANARIDAALGREICLRDGGIQALITGSIEKFGSTYALSAELVDPSNGRTVASFEQDAGSQNGVLAAVHLISNQLRHSLGEKLSEIHRSDLALQRVTTPSLKALQLYSKADQEMETSLEGQKVAFELLKQAIAEDPNFASAYILLAYSLSNQSKPASEFMPYAKRALELSGQASEQERYFIKASYYLLSGQVDRAITAFEALLQIDPTDYWATNNLFVLYSRDPARVQECNALAVRRADLRPSNLRANWMAGYREAIFGGSPVLARKYLGRAKALARATEDASPNAIGMVMWLQLYPAFQAWMKDDVALVARELNRAEKNPIMQAAASNPNGFGLFALTLGQVRRASALFPKVSGPGSTLDRETDLALLAYARGDESSLRYWLRQIARLPSSSGLLPLSLMLREGLLREANTAIRKLPQEFFPRPVPPWQEERVRGELLLAQGHAAKAIPLLREGMQHAREEQDALTGIQEATCVFIDADWLAQAYEKQGNLPAAVHVLENSSANRRRVYLRWGMAGAPLWMQDQMDLAKLYRRLGRVQDAEKIENELRKLLADADPDFPMLVELKKLQDTSSMASKFD